MSDNIKFVYQQEECIIVNIPCPLYKYMKLKHAIGLVRKGILRIGTLIDFRNHEKYTASVADEDEGKRVKYSEDEMDLSRPETVPPFLRKHIRADEAKYWKFSNIRFQVTVYSRFQRNTVPILCVALVTIVVFESMNRKCSLAH